MIIFLIAFPRIGSAGTWSINGSAQYLNGDYIYTTATSTYYFGGGIRYQAVRWNAGVSLPIIAQNNDLVSGSGGVFIPSHRGENGGDGEPGGGHHGGGMMGGGRITTDHMVSHFEFGLGDIYLSGQYQLINERGYRPSLAISSQLKIPTANKALNYGTGEFDYGFAVNLSKRWNNYAGFVDIGYWILGDSPEIKYEDPFSYGIGIGRFFGNGQFSALLYYQGYTTVLENYDPPRQGSLGLYYRMSDQTILSATATAGLSNTSADFGLSLGFRLSL